MRKHLCFFLVFLCFASPLFGQGAAASIRAGGTLPAHCISGTFAKDIFIKSGASAGIYYCSATDTWTKDATAGGSGDVSGPGSSVDSEIALFSGTGGKTIQRASGSGIAKLTSGVLSTVTAPSGTIVGTTDAQSLSNKKLASLTTNGPVYTSAGDGTLNSEATLSAVRGGNGADFSGCTGVLLFASGTATCTGTSGTSTFARTASPTFSGTVAGASYTATGTFQSNSGSDFVKLNAAAAGGPEINIFKSGVTDWHIRGNSSTGAVDFLQGAGNVASLSTAGGLTVASLALPALTITDASAPVITITKTSQHSFSWNGATNSHLKLIDDAATTIFDITRVTGDIAQPKTVTAGGTTGAQTINKPTGSVNFAASATSLVVTNSLVTANSIINCTVATNDSTMKSVQCVAGSGSFTMFANAAATAETRVNFRVTN